MLRVIVPIGIQAERGTFVITIRIARDHFSFRLILIANDYPKEVLERMDKLSCLLSRTLDELCYVCRIALEVAPICGKDV